MHAREHAAALTLQRRVYYGAMVFNALLRLTWIASLVRWPHGTPGTSAYAALACGRMQRISDPHSVCAALVLPTVLAFLEVFRRCVWNYFRIENEHVANAGAFRATSSVPLPGQKAGKAAKAAAAAARSALAASPAAPTSGRPSRRLARRVPFDDDASAAPWHSEAEGSFLLGSQHAGSAAAAAAAAAAADDAAADEVAAPPARKASSEWDRTAFALKRVGTNAKSLALPDDEDGDGDTAAAPAEGAPADAPEAAEDAGAAALESAPLKPRPAFGEHFNWEAGDHSDDDL